MTTNSSAIKQKVQRGVIQPDFLFVAEDLGLVVNLVPALTSRSGTGTWVDNDALNGADDTTQSSGPGVIGTPVRISFSNQLPYFSTDTAVDEFPGEDNALKSVIWGSFDATTNPPVIYPFNGRLTISELRHKLLQPPTE